ncbi:MAG: class I tRNA ligase family protein, partial [Thermomicrobiaceae bacterium]
MALMITNTMTGQKEPFETIESGKVTMYVCGPTVYSEAHIGHAMSAIVFDVIRRYLEYRGYQVVHAQNFTDVDDKIIARANQLGVSPDQLAEDIILEWMSQSAQLNIKPATLYPRATQEIGTIIGLINRLIESGHAYHA